MGCLSFVRCLQTQGLLPWVDIWRGPSSIKSRARGCGSSSRTKSCTPTLPVRYVQPPVIRSSVSWCFGLSCLLLIWNLLFLLQDVAALESQPLLGFVLKADALQNTQFKLYHQDKLYYMFKADDVQTAQRYRSKNHSSYFILRHTY